MKQKQTPQRPEAALMLSADDVAALLNCCRRTVYRLCDSGRLPRPIRLGALSRWPRSVIEQWVADLSDTTTTARK